jgi:hypothetical protein
MLDFTETTALLLDATKVPESAVNGTHGASDPSKPPFITGDGTAQATLVGVIAVTAGAV